MNPTIPPAHETSTGPSTRSRTAGPRGSFLSGFLGQLTRLQREVIGLNRRNVDCIFPNNPRSAFPAVDDKLLAKALLERDGIPTPLTRMVVESHRDLERFFARRGEWSDFAVKPTRGAGGRGFRLGVRDTQGRFTDHRGRPIDDEELRFHLAAILAGECSLDGMPDRALVEELLREDPAIAAIHGGIGVSDVRVIACQGRPIMAMLRLPTASSGGAANLHAGGVGVGIELTSGMTTFAVTRGRPIDRHPDTGRVLAGIGIPDWQRIIAIAERVNAGFGMGYLGVDCVLERRGALVLEVNGRPGLAIQVANRQGLACALAAAGVPIP